MKNFKFFTLVIMVAAFFVGNSVFAGAQDFRIDNITGSDIMNVYISPSHSGTWGPDRITGYLYDGSNRTFTFNNYSETYWDIKIVYRDSRPDAVWTNLNLKKIYRLVLRNNSSGGTTAIKYEI